MSLGSLFYFILVFGTIAIHGQQQCSNVNSGVDYSPGSNDILFREGFGLGGCCDLCKVTPGCKAFAWRVSTKTCWLKSTNTPKTIDEDVISGLPEPSAQPIGQQCHNINSGVDYSPGSHDMLSREGFDLGRCCDLCKVTSGCKAFVWSKSGKTCWLKSTDTPIVYNEDRMSGFPEPATPIIPPQQCYNVNSGVDYSPGSHDILSREGFDLAGCCDLCKVTPGCKAYVWSKSGLTCWLKSSDTPKTRNDDRISGLADPPLQGHKQCSGSVIPGIEYSPGANSLLSPRGGLDLEGCCDLCKVTPKCKAFVWSKSSKTCWVKSTTTAQVRNEDRTSGIPAAIEPVKECSAINSGWDIAPGTHDLTWTRGVDLATCCEMCNKEKRCRAFVWRKSRPECWLKEVDFPRVRNDDTVVGVRSDESALPPVPVAPPASTCSTGTPEELESAFRMRLCYHSCIYGNESACQCCKDEGFSGGKCMNGFAYCFE